MSSFHPVLTLGGGTWRIAGCADYFTKHEFGWRISPTQNRHDAIAAVEQAIAEVEALLGHSLLRDVTDTDGLVHPVKLVSDAFESLKYEHLYRHEIADGVMLADQAEHYRRIFNTIRTTKHCR